MADPLLSSLCRICHINPPKYTCPRCSLQTCSLPCSRRHKGTCFLYPGLLYSPTGADLFDISVWASCSGVRDPTVFKPLSQIATPSGIDHDYNFLHSIEYKIQRSEKEIIEERGLVDEMELRNARLGVRSGTGRPQNQARGEECIRRKLREMGTRIDKAPNGMTRNVENRTYWCKRGKSIYWQIEWIREGDAGKMLSRATDKIPLAKAYVEAWEDERRENMSADEISMVKKRQAADRKQRSSKRRKLEKQKSFTLTSSPVLQDPETTMWNTVMESPSELRSLPEPMVLDPVQSQYHFYLLRPYTPSIFPKVLIPLDSSRPLSELLRNRVLLEFPTIYVLEHSPENGLPEIYMLEKDFCFATGQGLPPAPLRKESGSSDEDGSDDDDDSGDAMSISNSEEEGSEEGEIV